MRGCRATPEAHCCWLGDHGVCRWFDTESALCTIRARHDTWDATHADPDYADDVRPKLRALGVTVDCGDWPPPGDSCGSCGASGG